MTGDTLPILMSASNHSGLEKSFVEKYEQSSGRDYYMPVICKVLQCHQNYKINRCFPDFPDGGYGARFKDTLGPDNFLTLSLGVFRWLINICQDIGTSVG